MINRGLIFLNFRFFDIILYNSCNLKFHIILKIKYVFHPSVPVYLVFEHFPLIFQSRYGFYIGLWKSNFFVCKEK